MRIPPRPLGESAFESAATLRAALDKIAAAADPAAAARATGPALAPASGVQLRLELNYRSQQVHLHIIHRELPLQNRIISDVDPPRLSLRLCSTPRLRSLRPPTPSRPPSSSSSSRRPKTCQRATTAPITPCRRSAPHTHTSGSAPVGPTFLIWQVVRVSDQEAEARYVVHQIQRMRLAAEGSPPSIGILYRTNAQARHARDWPPLFVRRGLTCADSSRRCPSSASCSARSSRTS